MQTKKKKADQKTLQKWHEKGFWWVFNKECTLCGAEFYTLDQSQINCNKCEAKSANSKKRKNDG